MSQDKKQGRAGSFAQYRKHLKAEGKKQANKKSRKTAKQATKGGKRG